MPIEILDLRESPIKEEMFDIEDKMGMFYLTLNFDETEDVKNQCLDARSYMDSCRILVRNLIDMDENEHIQKYPKRFEWLLDNLGRVEKNLNDIESETIEQLEKNEKLWDRELPKSPKIRKYTNTLIKYMEHLVYYPLKKAWDYCKKRDINDRDRYLYSVFIELSNSAESLGAISAEKVKTTAKHPGISHFRASHEDEEDFTKPEDLPAPESEDEEDEQIEEYEFEEDDEKEEQEEAIFG